MENKTSVTDMLEKTKMKLDNIKELNKEIHAALDVIEKRRNIQQATTASSCAGDDHDAECPAKNPVSGTIAIGATKDDNPSESSAVAEKMIEETSGVNGQNTTEQVVKDKIDSGEKVKVKGILKAPKEGLKISYGFKGRLDLDFNHVMYGSKLKRTVSEMNQDNRLCLEFGLEPNFGSIYESRRHHPPEANQVTALTTRVMPVDDDLYKHMNSRDTNVAQRSKPREKLVAKRQSQRHFKPNTEDTLVSKVKKKQTPKKEVKQSQTHSEIPVKVPEVKDGEGQQLQRQMDNPFQLQVPREDWLNLITGHANIDDQLKEGVRQNIGTFADVFFGKGENINPLELLTMTKDTFTEKMLNMLPHDENLSEENKQQIAELLTNTFFDENGKIDMLKCLQPGKNIGFMSEQFQSALSKILGQVGPSNDDKETVEDVEEEISKDKDSMRAVDTTLSHGATALTNKTEENDKDVDDSEVERIDINPDLWTQYANDEVVKGKVARDVRESGMDTVICLDLSQSMKGYAWEQATTFINNFVEGIQNSTLMDTSYEHIALVTYGSETRVQQHLTCDYVEIFRKLHRLKPAGPSPMYAGLQMVHAAILGAGMVFKSNGYRMYPRVFLITDGKATPAGMISGPDKCPPELFQKEEIPILKVVKDLHDKYHVTINPVPVGVCDTTILEKILHISKGKMISPEDWKMQSRVFKNYLAAAKLCGGPFAKLLAPGLKTMMLDAIDASPEDKVQMEEFLHKHEQEDEEDENHESDSFPPLGSRVRDYTPGSTITGESMKALGTITKHFADGHVGITWDEPNKDGTIREKRLYLEGARNIIVVDEPRVLKKDEMIAEGCRVKRGKDWSYTDQDGGPGNLGTVYIVKENGIVNVRWDNGNKNTYKFGAEGKFDLEIVTRERTNEIIQKAVHKEITLKENDDSTEAMRVQIMNERNRSIYDVERSETSGGAISQVPADGSCKNSKNERNSSPAKKVDDKKIITENNTSNGRHTDEVKSSTAEYPSESTSRREHIQHSTVGTTFDTSSRPLKSVEKKSGERSENKVEWMWLKGETWRPYARDIIDKIEAGYKRNPRGTTVIRLNETMYRVVFPRMEKINIETKEKYPVKRET